MEFSDAVNSVAGSRKILLDTVDQKKIWYINNDLKNGKIKSIDEAAKRLEKTFSPKFSSLDCKDIKKLYSQNN
jgi:hypothetical protein